MKTTIKQTAPSARRLVSFGITDVKGREIGVSISTAPMVATEVPEDWKGIFHRGLENGEYISVRISATRNGNEFGSTQPCSYFRTQAEADAAIEKRIKSTRARYAKQFA
tara:strand:- start:37 stop:363 length:327 start_codon:yes stop_codon:yes gene_type:complete